MTSIGNMIKRLDGLCGTGDLKPREDAFVESVVHTTRMGDITKDLTEPQVKWITDLFTKHFAG